MHFLPFNTSTSEAASPICWTFRELGEHGSDQLSWVFSKFIQLVGNSVQARQEELILYFPRLVRMPITSIRQFTYPR